MRQTCHEVLKELNIQTSLFDVAMELERIALNDPYFIDHKLYPNVDFYSGYLESNRYSDINVLLLFSL